MIISTDLLLAKSEWLLCNEPVIWDCQELGSGMWLEMSRGPVSLGDGNAGRKVQNVQCNLLANKVTCGRLQK